MADAGYIHFLTQTITDILELHPEAIISGREFRRMFSQKERQTALGNAIMDLCGLPDEKESMRRWARANEFNLLRDVLTNDWRVTRVRPGQSPVFFI
jgi:hypothetical protein